MAETIVYIGAYTQSAAEGIRAFRLDPHTGALESVGNPTSAKNPSFLTKGPGNRLYTVAETEEFRGGAGGGVAAYAIGPDGALRPLGSEATHGGSPCFLTVSGDGRFLLAANYAAGTVSVFPLREDGAIAPCSDIAVHQGHGPVADRQEKAHAHCVVFTPDGERILAADLGTDRVKGYRLDRTAGRLIPEAETDIVLRPGTGPRHLEFGRQGLFLYVVGELSSEVAVFRLRDGRYENIQYISALPDGYTGQSFAAAIHFSPDGRYLYVSNRGHDSIARFEAGPASGRLTLRGITPCGGRFPRDFAISPDGRFLVCANQNSDSLTVFSVGSDGSLTIIPGFARIGSPSCVRFVTLP